MDDEKTVKENPEENLIKQELSGLSFEEVLKLQERLGTKVLKGAIHGDKYNRSNGFKRENKNRPREISSKKPVSTIRPIYDIKPKLNRDPRFDDLSGEFNEDLFNQSYKFLKDLRSNEKKVVEKNIATEADHDMKTKMKSLLQSMTAKEHFEMKKEKDKKAKKEMRQKHKEVVEQGKKPWFQNKAEKRKLELIEKYDKLKKSGQLEKYMLKKRKRNASKDKTKLPKKVST